MQTYTKLIMALAGVLVPFLDQAGVPLPPFLTIEWLQGLLLALTPVAVWFFPNKPKADPNAIKTNSPAIVGVLALIVACFMLEGCSTPRPKIDSISDAIAVTAADVETAAQTVKDLCRNTVPDGACAPDALISTSTKDRYKGLLRMILERLRSADRLLAADQQAEAEDMLGRAQTLLLVLRAELRHQQT